MESKRELPFGCEILDDGPVEVKNPFSGESCMLEPDAVAVYDTILGAEVMQDWDTAAKGKAWFAKHFIDEYYILID